MAKMYTLEKPRWAPVSADLKRLVKNRFKVGPVFNLNILGNTTTRPYDDGTTCDLRSDAHVNESCDLAHHTM